MAAITDILITIFCQQNTQSQCTQFITQYPDITQQVMWLVFFPTVFLLLFIFFLTEGVTKTVAKKYKTVLSIAIYLFIIFQGWYHYFLSLSKFWFISVIVLGGFFVFIRKMGAASSNGSSSGSGGMRKLMSEFGQRGMKSVKSDVARQELVTKNALREMRRTLDLMKNDKGDNAKALETFHYQSQAAETALRALNEMVSVRGFHVGSNYSKLEKEWEKLSKEGLEKEGKSLKK